MASHTDAHTIELLEFRQVLSAMGEFCFSEELPAALIHDFAEGPDGFAGLAPVLDPFADAVGIVRRALLKNDARISERLPSVQTEAAILEKPGFVLELESIGRLSSFLRATVAIRSFFSVLAEKARDSDGRDNPEGMAFLSAAIGRIPDLKAFSSEIARSVDESGQLREDQIPELRKARMKIGQANAELRKAAQNIVVQKSEYVSSDFTTVRDGRVVIPLRSDFKGRVQGIVHQSSTSGNTLFLEPFELVAFNNASAQAEQEYAIALHAVLRDLSARFAAQLPHIQAADRALRAIDDLYCRACHSISIDGCGAERSDTIALRAARHPLLGSKAIPIDIEYEADARLLVISGPNTGGKTVALKTLGLLSLMNQAGMEIPAVPGSGLPIFSGIFADIGDEQSLYSNLSTFSGHIARIASILENADSESLVLMDELGSGTDPQEGGVLAQAVAEKLVSLHCRALVTSHHGTLKALAFSTPGVMNASMEFSDQEMRPTYRVINGIPGQSHALDISLRVGLGGAVVARARELLEGNDSAVDKLVRDLGRTKAELLETQDELRGKRSELETRESEIAARDQELRSRESELKREQAREISSFLREARSRVESLLRNLSALKSELDPESAEKIQKAAQDARAEMLTLSSIAPEEDEAESDLPGSSAFAPGMEVHIVGAQQNGVLERRAKSGRWVVQSGGKRIEFPENRLSPVSKSKSSRERTLKPVYQIERGSAAAFSLDVRGMRAQEAIDSLVRQIDAALVQGLDFFSIIHGKGEGILQQALWERLRDSPGVEKFAFARPEDGGTGKTLVYLRA